VTETRETRSNLAAWTIIAGALTITVSMGVRQTYGLFIQPFTAETGVTVTTFAMAIAIQNLIWGLAQPVAGAAADSRGAGRVLVLGGILYTLGMALTAIAEDPYMLILGAGILVGLGLSCTTFAVVLGVVGRRVSEERRSFALGIASAGGSVGQMLLVPFAQGMIDYGGFEFGLLAMAGVAFIIVPTAFILRGDPAVEGAVAVGASRPLGEVLREARGHSGYCLLTLGFFVCGFQVTFIGTHLPGYLVTIGLPAVFAATALATVGFFNIIGTWTCGLLGGKYRFKDILSWLYFLRGTVILLFLFGPKTYLTVILFSGSIGLLWLATVPITSALVAQIFGVRNLGMLFGVVFLSHQLGSFLGAWLGGLMYDVTGSYDLIWFVTAGLGFAATLIHMPINDRAVPQAA